ncbi:MAG TPA: ATP-binding protein [Pyrinomonadaceae bacterium]
MGNKSTVISALKNAVTADPNDLALRVHLASLLVNEGEAQEALVQLEFVLQSRPDDLEALRLAVTAAEATGQHNRANSYRRILKALGDQVETSKPLTDEVLVEYDDGPVQPEEPHKLGVAEQTDTVLDANDEIWDFEEPKLKLADVAGMENVKERLQLSFLGPLKQPELMKHYGKSLRGGLLLFGPPGCGKTFIARATAGELKANFLSVGLSDVLDMWLGNSEKNLHEIFERARRKAPCVVFFDEIDALGRKRTLMRNSAASGVVNQLLAEMDSIGNNNEGVFVLAATNHPWDVDTALRRPGRLDRTLLVLPPNAPAREAVFRYHLRERPIGSIDFGWLASQTEGFSGADIAHVCESAAELAIHDSIKSGNVRSIEFNDLRQALKRVSPSTNAWFDTAKNFAVFANEGGVYDDLLDYLKRRKIL